MNIRFYGIVVAAFIVHGFAVAETFDAKDLVELAVTKNPELKALRLESEAHLNFSDQEARWENPNLDIGGDQKSQPGGVTRFAKIGLSQQFVRPSRRKAKVDNAKISARLAQVREDDSEVHLRNEVWKLIYEYRIASEKAEHAKERLQRFRTVGTYLHSRVFAAPQKQAEAVIVRSKLLLLGKEFRELEADRKISWNRLNLFLGLKDEPAIKAEWFTSARELSFEKLLEKAKSFSPAVRSQKFKILRSENELRLSQTNYLPGFTLNASYADGSGFDPEKVYGLGVSIALPIWDFSGSAMRGSESLLSAEQIRLNWTEEQVSQELKSALESYASAKTALDELKIADLPKLEREMQSIDRNFKKGHVDLLVYIEADAEHFASLNAIFDSQAEFAASRAAIFEMIGQSPFVLE